jgi:phage terminase large subunit GpA-like protein
MIHWHVFDGDTGQSPVWAAFWQQLQTPYRHRSGADVWIAGVAIDAGFNTGKVTDFCETARSRGRIAIPVVGRPGRGKPLLQSPTEQKWKRTRRQVRPVYTVHVDAGKDLFYARLRIEKPGPEYVHFPEGLDPVFYDQLTPEVLRLEYHEGQPYRKWVLPPDRRNETQDCSIYAMAAFKHLGPKVRAELAIRAKAFTDFKGAKGVAAATPASRGGMVSEVTW